MSGRIDAVQVRRWQEEVARDPGSPGFLPLAELYRREGRLDVARRLCARGLERHPEHVEAHVLLGRIFRESGELDRALDELDIALRLDPEHRAARRALGYLCLERRDWTAAVRHLELAAVQDPADDRVVRALTLARRHAEAVAPAPVAEESTEPPAELSAALERFLRESRVRLALLLEGNGRILMQHGFSSELDLAAFASLGAGVHSASRMLAQMLGQPGFEQLYQGTGERQLFLAPISLAAQELVLVVVFGGETTIGLVRVHFDQLLREVSGIAWYPSLRAARPDAVTFEAHLSAGLQSASFLSR